MSRGPVTIPEVRSRSYPGRFIAFEGGEGAGKSTQVRRLAEHLRAEGRTVVTTREPGGAPVPEAIRGILLGTEDIDGRTEMLLFAAARAEHVRTVVAPALAAGSTVITDRYLDSSIAYQGVARGLGRDVVEALSLWVADGLVPDVTFVLDVEEPVGRERHGAPDRIEAEGADFHETVRRAFLGLAARAPYRYEVIDAGLDVDAVAAVVRARLGLPGEQLGTETPPTETALSSS